MNLVNDLSVSLDPEVARKNLRWRKSQNEIFTSALNIIHESITPRAVWVTGKIYSRERDRVSINGIYLNSRLLSRCVYGNRKIYPYLITLGETVENNLKSTENLLRRYIMEKLADMALIEAGLKLKIRLEKLFNAALSSLSPGSLEDWPLEEQKSLFALLGDGPGKLGVGLMDSMMMVPRKSLSGVFFVSKRKFISCRLCSRGDCDQRQAPFDPVITERYIG